MSGPGYNLDLQSMPPFMYVERYARVEIFGVIAFGAYNAMGLIGPEKGGVAFVIESPEKVVVATKDFPYDPNGRSKEFDRLTGIFKSPREWSPRGKKGLKSPWDKAMKYMVNSGYDVRGL